jgi:nucleoside phosphorylase
METRSRLGPWVEHDRPENPYRPESTQVAGEGRVIDELTCDLLLFFATSSERDALQEAAKQRGIPFHRKSHPTLGRFFWMDKVGDNRVNAVRTEMGPLSHGGSASQGIFFKSATGATAIIQLGMAFGIMPARQQPGDVLVSSSIIPYDRRDIRTIGETYTVDYAPARRHESIPSLLRVFQAERERGVNPFQVHIGAFLSGGARIHSRLFRDELVSSVPAGDDVIVGGEMEGVGLLSISPANDPVWIVVKGISDFADEDRDEVIEQNRPIACRNAADFVLDALLNSRHA